MERDEIRARAATAIKAAVAEAGGARDLAELADISTRSIRRYRAQETAPSPEICMRIAAETDVELWELRPDLWEVE